MIRLPTPQRWIPILAMLALASAARPGPTDAVYEPTWESLATAPIPHWWDDGKFGIFIHWGPYSTATREKVTPKR
jgi:hypothetical protein